MVIGIILAILALAQLALGLNFIFGHRKNLTLFWYGLFMIGASMYVGANSLGYLNWLVTQSQAEHLAWAGGAMTAIFILPFSYTFPLPRRTMRELLPLVIWPLVIFVPGFLFANAFIPQNAIVTFGDGYQTQPGDYFAFFLTFFAVYWLWSFVNFGRSLRNADGIHRQQVTIFLVGTAISILISGYFDIYRALIDSTHPGYIGSLCSSIWFGFTAYILLKK